VMVDQWKGYLLCLRDGNCQVSLLSFQQELYENGYNSWFVVFVKQSPSLHDSTIVGLLKAAG
jgi:hypothetical protein